MKTLREVSVFIVKSQKKKLCKTAFASLLCFRILRGKALTLLDSKRRASKLVDSVYYTRGFVQRTQRDGSFAKLCPD